MQGMYAPALSVQTRNLVMMEIDALDSWRSSHVCWLVWSFSIEYHSAKLARAVLLISKWMLPLMPKMHAAPIGSDVTRVDNDIVESKRFLKVSAFQTTHLLLL